MARLSFRCDEELLAAVDRARGDVARERWLRRAVEQMLRGQTTEASESPRAVELHSNSQHLLSSSRGASEQALGGTLGIGVPHNTPAPAEQPEPVLELEPGEEPYEPDPNAGCSRHPEAGRVREQGRWWCAEPGCSASFSEGKS